MSTFAASPRRAPRTAGALICALALTGAIYGSTVASGAPAPTEHLVVKFAPGTKAAASAAALKTAGATRRGIIQQLGVQIVTVPKEKGAAALTRLRASKTVRYAERDLKVTSHDTVPNDPLWSNQWGPRKVSAPLAWDTTLGDPSTVIAVIDTGVDRSQPDLTGGVLAGWDFIANDSDPADEHGHGTSASGVAAARTGNGVGIAGLCGGCAIMPLRALGADGSGSVTGIANAIVWATDRGADVINMSLGTSGDSGTLANAVSYAVQRDVVVVASAGNNGNTALVYPAAYPGVIAVAGTDGGDALYSWSTRGSWVEVAAPGCNVATLRGTGYGNFCGTSSAAPVVAGLAGLLRSAAPGASKGTIDDAITTSADPIAADIRHGRIDAGAATASLATPPATAAPSPVSAPVVSGTPEVGRVLTTTSGSWSGSPTGYAYAWLRCDTAGQACVPIAGATSASYTAASPDAGGTLRSRVTATNAAGSAAAESAPTATVTVPAPARVTTTFTGTLSSKKRSISFTHTIGAGEAAAALSWNRAGVLSLSLLSPDGTTLGQVSGGGPLSLSRTVVAGTHRWVVSASAVSKPTPFTLVVTHTAP
jgi:subtilisin family serine protease